MKQGVSIMGEHDPSKYELDLNVYPKIVTKELPVAFERGEGCSLEDGDGDKHTEKELR